MPSVVVVVSEAFPTAEVFIIYCLVISIFKQNSYTFYDTCFNVEKRQLLTEVAFSNERIPSFSTP